MLRTLFVLSIFTVGLRYAVRGPFYILLLYLWIAYFRPEDWIWTDFLTPLRPSYVVGLLAVLATVLSNKERLTWCIGSFLLALFLLHSLASTLQSIVFPYAWPYWYEFAKIAIVNYLIIVLVNNEARLRMTLLVIALSMSFEGAKQGWAQLVLNPGAPNFNGFPMLGDNNGVAIGMLVMLSVIIALVKTSKRRFERLALSFLGIGVLYRAISTYSRGGFLSLAAWTIAHIVRSERKIIGVLLAAALATSIGYVLPDTFWDRMRTIQVAAGGEYAVDSSAEGRLHFWSVALEMANQHPIFGVGHNSYRPLYNSYDTSHGAHGGGRSVHSLWLGLLAELGYVGLALFLIILARAFFVCARARRSALSLSEGGQSLAHYATAIEGALIICVVGGTFYPFQYNEMLWHLIALSTVVANIVDSRVRSTAPNPTTHRAVA